MREKLDEDCFCTVLVAVDSLIKNGKSHECSEKIATLLILINSYMCICDRICEKVPFPHI